MNSPEFLLLVKARLNCSYYKIAKILDIQPTRISSAKNGRESLTEKQVIDLCKLINHDPAKVLPGILAERTNDPEKKLIWERVAQLAEKGAATLTAVLIMAPALLAVLEYSILC